MSVLPKELEYVPVLPSLSDGTVNTSVVIQPSNGATFGENSIIQLDLPSRANSFLDPSTLYIRYKMTLTSAASAELKGACPVFTPFSNLQTIFGSQIVENVQNFGVVQSLITNITHSNAQKEAMAVPYGLTDYTITTAVSTLGQNLNSRLCTSNEVFTVSAPLRCILSESERLVPLGLMPLVRIQLTVDSIANIFTTAVVPTAISISNFELCYDSIDFGSNVSQMVSSMGEKIYIKSQSYATSSATLASGSSNTQNLIYNTRLSSVKSLIANFGGTAAASLNKLYDSYDITSNNGSYQYIIGGITYPQRPVSTANNKAGAFTELRLATGGLNTSTTEMSITPVEFAYISANTTTARLPAKFYFGSNTERLASNNILLSGISTQASPISLQLEIGSTATSQQHNIMLICVYDALIEITPSMKDATVKQ